MRTRWMTKRSNGALFALATVLAVTPAGASAPWSWSVRGALATRATCGVANRSTQGDVCSYEVANAPRRRGTETLTVAFTNDATRRTCYGVSVATSYFAGLHEVCVGAGRTGRYLLRGPATHFRATSLSLFVTSGRPDRPMAPVTDAAASPFRVTVTQSS